MLKCVADEKECDAFNSDAGCADAEQCARKNPRGSFASDQAHRKCLSDNTNDLTVCFECVAKVEIAVCKVDGDCEAEFECVFSFANAGLRCVADGEECDEMNDGDGCGAGELCKASKEDREHMMCIVQNRQDPSKCYECKVTATTKATTAQPTVATAPVTNVATTITTTLDLCNTIKCAITCESECGWSRAQNKCILGGRTSQGAIDERLGDCPATTTTITKTKTTTTFTTVAGDTSTATTPTTITTTMDPCNTIKCALKCESECGWSRAQNICVFGGQTSQSMIDDRLGDCPATTTVTTKTMTTTTFTTVVGETTTTAKLTTPSTTQDPCLAITCSLFCDGECGWSRARRQCMFGGQTSQSMIDERLGDCPTTTTVTTKTMTTTTFTTVVGEITTTAKPTTVGTTNDVCNSIMCSVYCTSSCGWSRARNMCVAGLSTSLLDISDRLGECADADFQTTVDPGNSQGSSVSVAPSTAAANSSHAMIYIVCGSVVGIVLLIAVAVISRSSQRNNNGQAGQQSFENPMYAAAPVPVTISSNTGGYAAPASSSGAGYMDVSGYDMSEA
jgi:hypothetical protein